MKISKVLFHYCVRGLGREHRLLTSTREAIEPLRPSGCEDRNDVVIHSVIRRERQARGSEFRFRAFLNCPLVDQTPLMTTENLTRIVLILLVAVHSDRNATRGSTRVARRAGM